MDEAKPCSAPQLTNRQSSVVNPIVVMIRFLVLAQNSAAQHQESLPISVRLILGALFLFLLTGWLLIWRAPTAERKRRLHRWFMIAVGVILFCSLCARVARGFPYQALFIAPLIIPIV